MGSDSKLVHVYMYGVKCVDVGSSKDPFLTQVSDFAVLVGNELDAEVPYFHLYHKRDDINFSVPFLCLLIFC